MDGGQASHLPQLLWADSAPGRVAAFDLGTVSDGGGGAGASNSTNHPQAQASLCGPA